jgi:hypothetical protein
MDARAEAPMPPKTSAYLPVEDLPSPREKPAMTPDERLKLKNELIAARDRQAAAGKAKGAAITEFAKTLARRSRTRQRPSQSRGGPSTRRYPCGPAQTLV